MSKEERIDRKKRAIVACFVYKTMEFISIICAFGFILCCIAESVYMWKLLACMLSSAVGFIYCNYIAHKISYQLYKHGYIRKAEVTKLATLRVDDK